MSGSAEIQILRQDPRRRDRLDGLAGRIRIKLRTCSESLGDPVNSYLHVGSGFLRLVIDEEDLRRRASQARSRAELERLVRELSEKIQMDYAQFVLTAGEEPFIPGSSVKGNVRSRLELSFVPRGGVVRCCLIRATRTPLQPPKPGKQGWRHFRMWERTLRFDRRDACNLTQTSESDTQQTSEFKVCLLCDIFGTAGLGGLIEFGDLKGKNVKLEPVKLFTLRRRPRGRLWAAPPGSTFEGTITFRNLKPEELGLLLYGMGMRDSSQGRPVLLGKLKYQGNLLVESESKYPRNRQVVFGVVRYELVDLELAPFSQPLYVDGIRVGPGFRPETTKLDELVKALVGRARSAFEGELLDVDEVRELERLRT